MIKNIKIFIEDDVKIETTNIQPLKSVIFYN